MSKKRFVLAGDSNLTMEKNVSFLVAIAIMALASYLASAYDPNPLQEFCVAIDEPKNAGIAIST